MKAKYRIILSALAFLPIIFLSGCGKEKSVAYAVKLEIWGTFDSSDAFTEIVSNYRKINPYVKEIKYRKFSVDTYKTELLDALASGQGPDIFLINNSWLPSFESKMEPAPQILIGPDKVKENFVDVVQADFISNGRIFALPLSVDSLALYYNKDLFNSAGITNPPATWEEFNEQVKKLTKIDDTGNILQSGVALGTAYNINRSTDILSLLMMQNGTEMVNKSKTASSIHNKIKDMDGKDFIAGERALQYYTQFSNNTAATYSWNNNMHYSLDAFSEGNLAMMFNYSWHIETIKNKNSKINFDVAPIPQLSQSNQINYANYWGYGVSKIKLNEDKAAPPNEVRMHEAWQFLKFLTLKNDGVVRLYNAYSKNSKDFPVSIDPAATYMEKTGRPAARRDLLERQKNNPIIKSFVIGNLTAKSWYQKNPEAIEKIMAEMLESVVRGGIGTYEALSTAANKITETMR